MSFQNGINIISTPPVSFFGEDSFVVEVMTDLSVSHSTVVKGFDECVDVVLGRGIPTGVVLWIQMVEPYGNLETEVVGILVIGKVKTVPNYSTVTDFAKLRG